MRENNVADRCLADIQAHLDSHNIDPLEMTRPDLACWLRVHCGVLLVDTSLAVADYLQRTAADVIRRETLRGY